MDLRVSRRGFLQNVMALASSPMLPRLPVAEAATVAETVGATASPVAAVLTPFQKYLARQVSEFVSSQWQYETHAERLADVLKHPFISDKSKKIKNDETWIMSLSRTLMSMNINSVEPLLYILKCGDWKSNLATKKLSYYEDEEIYKRTFANDSSIRSAIYKTVNDTLAVLNPDGVPEKDSIAKDNLRITYHEQARYFSIEPKKQGAYSRSDIHFLMESEFMKVWGFRPRFFDLSPEHTEIIDTIEQHPLMRHALAQVYNRNLYFWEYFGGKDEEFDPFNSGFKPWSLIPEDKKKELEEFFKTFEAVWPERTKGKYGFLIDSVSDKKRFYQLRFNYDDIEQTLHDPEEFIRRAKKYGEYEARNLSRRAGTQAFHGATFEAYPRQYSPDAQEAQDAPCCPEGYIGMWKVHHHGLGSHDIMQALRVRFSSAVSVTKIRHQLYVMPGFGATDKDLALLDSKPYEPHVFERFSVQEKWEREYKSFKARSEPAHG